MGNALHHDEDWLREKYVDEGLSLAEMGELAGVSHTTIANWMERHEIPRIDHAGGEKVTRVTYYDRRGYGSVQSNNDTAYVHRLAAVAWFGLEQVAGNVVHHKNGFKFDNREENLDVMTDKDHGIEHNGDSDKPHHDPDWLQSRLDEGLTQKEIAEMVGVSQPTISDKVRRLTDKEKEADGLVMEPDKHRK